MKILLFSLISFFAVNTFATTTITAVSGTSNTVDLESTTSIEILAGVSGSSKCSDASIEDITKTFNSCELLNNTGACNLKTVCSTTKLFITLKSGATGDMVLIDEDKNIIKNWGSYTAESSEQFEIPWSTVCTAVSGSCNTAGSKTLKIGVNNAGDNDVEDGVSILVKITMMPESLGVSLSATEGDGIADYSLYPGDEKAFVTEISTVQDYDVDDAAEIVGVRAFFEAGSCPGAVTNSSDSFLMDLDSDTKELSNSAIDEGMENDQEYVVMMGFEDKAGNIGVFKDLSTDCVTDIESVTPRNVYGLLEEDQNCFISTAAFGSPLNDKVKTFKLLRDQILKKFSLGQKFIKFYYKNSPPLANQIKESKTLRAIARALLWPAWAISAAVLYLGLMPFLFVVTMTLLSFVFLRNDKLRNKKSKKTLLILGLFFAAQLFSGQNLKAEEDFFSTSESVKAAPAETAPKEPPYSENDEFSELEKSAEESVEAEKEYEPEIEAPQKKSYESGIKESPDKWKPYQRVPEKTRLKELSDEGLMKITKKGGYNYKVKPSEQKSAASFRFGMASFPNLENASGTVTFADVYGEDKKPVLLIDYEWQFFKSFGKLGLKLGSGLMFASGNGRLDYPYAPTGETEAMEKYNLYMFPNSLSAVYRFDIFNKQWLVPFGEVGVDYLGFIEARDDGEEIKFGGAPHFHFAVGGSFLLDTLGKDMMAEIDSQYGVNHLWLTAEFRHLEAIGDTFDFTDDIVNAGLMIEF